MKKIVLLILSFSILGCAIFKESEPQQHFRFNTVEIGEGAEKLEILITQVVGKGVGFSCVKSPSGKCGFKVFPASCEEGDNCMSNELVELRVVVSSKPEEEFVWYETKKQIKYSYFKI